MTCRYVYERIIVCTMYALYELLAKFDPDITNGKYLQNFWGDVGGYLGLLLGWSHILISISLHCHYNVKRVDHPRSCYSLITACPQCLTSWVRKIKSGV